jgi:Trp operon repressor
MNEADQVYAAQHALLDKWPSQRERDGMLHVNVTLMLYGSKHMQTDPAATMHALHSHQACQPYITSRQQGALLAVLNQH